MTSFGVALIAAWWAVLFFVWCLCRAAALADRNILSASPRRRGRRPRPPSPAPCGRKAGTMSKQHYRLIGGHWHCRNGFSEWWLMPLTWKPGDSVEGFVWP